MATQCYTKTMQDVFSLLREKIAQATGVDNFALDLPDIQHGDITTNVALIAHSDSNIRSSLFRGPLSASASCSAADIANPKDLAELLKEILSKDEELSKIISKIEVAGPGFLNFWLKKDHLITEIGKRSRPQTPERSDGERVMVEYAHPNTHKEMHIGHMRTLIVGEALARMLSHAGAEVFRANYQGDIGPHVAKSIWGVRRLIQERGLSWEQAEQMNDREKAHLLGEGYALGNKLYEDNKDEIDSLNAKLYKKETDVKDDYERTRGWSLKYYDTFYSRFNTKFDKLYFESDTASKGKEIVQENLGKVFTKSEGAVVFEGEKYGLHTRVFITSDGNPTYEGKDIGLAFTQYDDFAFDKNIHVVANEQTGYFKVVFKALAMIDEKFTDKEYHLPMGMVNLVGKKMSSRSGEVFTVDELLDEVKSESVKLIDNKDLSEESKEDVAEKTTLAAVKYSVLNTGAKQDVAFDVKTSVSLDGNSGPYILYTYARIKSLLDKGGEPKEGEMDDKLKDLVRMAFRYNYIVTKAAEDYAPNVICTYLYQLAQAYNTFYNSEKIVGTEAEPQKLYVSGKVADTLRSGLDLLGIQTVERM